MRTAVKYPDPILLKKAEDFVFETDKELLKELVSAAREGFGWGNLVGLAAPQIGISKRFFLALEKMYINPTIVERSEEVFVGVEGCYSCEENKNYNVTRNVWIVLEWQDRGKNWHKKKFTGFAAEVIQHEYDHLIGKLCSQKEA